MISSCCVLAMEVLQQETESNGPDSPQIDVTNVPKESNPTLKPEVGLSKEQDELDYGYRIINDIIKQNRSTCWDFLDQVDAEGLGLWDYHSRIKQPMWLNKILDKFADNSYKTVTEPIGDFRLMVENCYRYNGTDHVISKKARRLELLLEGKLALLKPEIRSKTTIQVTSKGKYTSESTEDLQPYHVLSRSSSRQTAREYTATGEELRLMFDFVRCEECMLTADDGKNITYRERRQQEALYRQLAGNWIASIQTNETADYIKHSHALPEIGFFMHLSQSVMKFPNLSMYKLERCLLIPDKSLYLSKIMSSLLCTYPERSLLASRPPMHYRTWNERLRERICKWFEKVVKYRSYARAADKFNICIEFFETLKWQNPFADPKITFDKLSYHEKTHVVKALCDNLSSLQSIQSLFNNCETLELQCMRLGYDLEGNMYIYFPQFCGDDVRLYRHKQYIVPQQLDHCPDDDIDTLLHTQAAMHMQEHKYQNDDEINEIHAIVRNVVENLVNEISIKEEVCEKTSEIKSDSTKENENDVPESVEQKFEVSEDVTTEIIKSESQEDYSSQESDARMEYESQDSQASLVLSSQDNLSQEEVVVKKKRGRKRGSKNKLNLSSQENGDFPIIPPDVRRSSRKRTSTVKKEVSPPPTPTKKRNKRTRKTTPRKQRPPQPEERFGSVKFELLCEEVDDLQVLVSRLEATLNDADLSLYTKAAPIEMLDLIEQVKWLLGELKPFDGKMTKAKVEAQISMKREYDEVTRDQLIYKPDVWNGEDVEKMAKQHIHPSASSVMMEYQTGRRRSSPVVIYSDDGDNGSDDDYLPEFEGRPVRVTNGNNDHYIDSFTFDETLFEAERLTLLPAALDELGRILRKNIRLLTKITDRSSLRESAQNNDRKTRLKSKTENKVVVRVLLLALSCIEQRPSLIPLLVPSPEIVETIDLVLTEEDFAKREAQRTRKAKKTQITIPKKRTVNALREAAGEQPIKFVNTNMVPNEANGLVDDLENIIVKKSEKTLRKSSPVRILKNGGKYAINKTIGSKNEDVLCRVNGQVCPAVKLNDGRIIPIARPNNMPQAFDLLNGGINKFTQKSQKQHVPYISLKSPQKTTSTVTTTPSTDSSLRNSAALALVNLQNGAPQQLPITTTRPMQPIVIQRSAALPTTKLINVQIPVKKRIQVPANSQVINYVVPITKAGNQFVTLAAAPQTKVVGQNITQPRLSYVAPVLLANTHRIVQPSVVPTNGVMLLQTGAVQQHNIPTSTIIATMTSQPDTSSKQS